MGVISEQKSAADKALDLLFSVCPSAIAAGGAPRDWYLGIPAKDIDIVQAALEIEKEERITSAQTPEFKAKVIAAETVAKADAIKAMSDKAIAPIKEQAAAAKEAGLPTPPDTYFMLSTDAREKSQLADQDVMQKWEMGENEKGKAYIRSRATVSKLKSIAALQDDVTTGGVIWGSDTVNAIRTRLDADANLMDSLSKSLIIDTAKEVYPVSNTDITILQSMGPSLSSPGESNAAKVQAALAVNQGRLDEFRFYDAYQNKWGTLKGASSAFQRYQDANPYFDAELSTPMNLIGNDNRQLPEEFIENGPPQADTGDATTKESTKTPVLPSGYEFLGFEEE